MIGIKSSRTCSEACWRAVEDVCSCDCLGVNHGCMRSANGVRPDRTSRIDGVMYKLIGVGKHSTLLTDAVRINNATVKEVIKYTTWDGKVVEYNYRWRETDKGAPARLKTATKAQVEKWPELVAFWQDRFTPYLLWAKVDQEVVE